jgi:prolyl oligopeptidase
MKRVLVGLLALGAGLVFAADTPPPAPRRPVVDVYHGVKVVDDYRWLENYSDPAVRTWSGEENAYARRYLDALPMRDQVAKELSKLYDAPSTRYTDLESRGGMLFALKFEPPKQQPMLVTLDENADPHSERVVVDPNRIDPTGGTEIDFYVPSLDGKHVAVSLSHGGSESGDVHVFEVGTGKPTGDVIPRVNGGTAGGSVAWNGQGTGFYYTRYPHKGERPDADLVYYQQVYFHKLGGNPADDTYSVGKGFPKIAEITLATSADGRYVLARMANGDGGQFAHYLLGPSGHWSEIAGMAEQVEQVKFGPHDELFLLSHADAPMGKILRMPAARPRIAEARTAVDESKTSIDGFVPGRDRIYVNYMNGGPSEIGVFSLDGKNEGMVPIRPVSGVSEPVRLPGDNILFNNVSYLEPPAWYRYNPATRKATETALRETSSVNFRDAEVIRDFAISKDGTRIPVNIIRKKGAKLDGNNPALLTGYGGFDISITPEYSPRVRFLLDHGFVYAVANLRGGGEYGEAWHRAGMLTHKQNVFDDFAAAAHYLIDHHYTSASRLAIEGGSNGGLLMGAELTQHPHLFGAVVTHVGIYDMLRLELESNGAFNVTEYGTVKEPDEFRALYAYSPYQHVVDGTQYPAVLFLTGANDPRVDPANSRKMVARLQASGTRRLVLLRTSAGSGHGIGTRLSERVAQDVDVMSFLLAQLHVR